YLFPASSLPHFSTLSLHDALPICFIDTGGVFVHQDFGSSHTHIRTRLKGSGEGTKPIRPGFSVIIDAEAGPDWLCALSRAFESRSEEHTSELQSRGHLVCRLLLEK